MRIIILILIGLALAACKPQTQVAVDWTESAKLNGDELLNLQVPSSWQPFDDYKKLLELEKKYMMRIPQPYTGDCIELWKNPPKITHKNHEYMKRCYKKIFDEGYENPDYLKRVLLGWASSNKEPLQFSSNLNESNPDAYEKQSILGLASYWYALNYNHPDLHLASSDRALIEKYLTNRLMKEKFPQHELNNHINCLAYIQTPEKLPANADTNTCGSTRWKISLGEVALGMRLGNQELFSKGNRDLFVNLSMVDSDAIYVPYAARGGKAYGYYRETPHFMSHLVELYKSIGFDFFAYKLPHGASVKDFFDMSYDILGKDFHIMDKYAYLNVGAVSYPFSKVEKMSHNEFISSYKNCLCGEYSFKNGYFYAMNQEYMERFKPTEVPDKFTYMDDTNFFIANAISLHESFK